jgi:hypothetical protein
MLISSFIINMKVFLTIIIKSFNVVWYQKIEVKKGLSYDSQFLKVKFEIFDQATCAKI